MFICDFLILISVSVKKKKILQITRQMYCNMMTNIVDIVLYMNCIVYEYYILKIWSVYIWNIFF